MISARILPCNAFILAAVGLGERISERGGRLLFDGAMGTELWFRGVPPGRCLEEANITDPNLVTSIHEAYIEAGADVIRTNTFGANRVRLAHHHLGASVGQINRAGAELARTARLASDRAVIVAGSIGPLGASAAASGSFDASAAAAAFQEQIGALVEGGVELLVMETFMSVAEASVALAAARAMAPALPAICLMSLDEHDDGVGLAALAGQGAAAVGFNCGQGPLAGLKVARTLDDLGLRWVAVAPNAGLPSQSAGKLLYPFGPADFVATVPALLKAGVAIYGGCCGTRPAHINAMRTALDLPTARGSRSDARAYDPC